MNIIQSRLQNQHLIGKKFSNPEDVVEYFGAIQAQEYPSALYSIGLRMNDANEKLVEKAVLDKKIVRTWPMRGTLHFVMPENIRWMLKYLTPRVERKMQSYLRKSEIDEIVLKKSTKIFEKALANKKQLTRNALMQALEDNGVPTKDRGYHILAVLAQRGLVCFGPKKGKQHTLVLLEEWVPKAPEISQAEAFAKLAGIYFQSHGPATVYDFCWWSGLAVMEGKKAIEDNNKLTSEKVGDKEFWVSTSLDLTSSLSQTFSKENLHETTFLLPPYDEYTVAYKDRSELTGIGSKILYTSNGFWSTMILNGKVVGMWRKETKKDVIEIAAKPSVKLSSEDVKGFEKEAERYGEFFGMNVKLTFG